MDITPEEIDQIADQIIKEYQTRDLLKEGFSWMRALEGIRLVFRKKQKEQETKVHAIFR